MHDCWIIAIRKDTRTTNFQKVTTYKMCLYNLRLAPVLLFILWTSIIASKCFAIFLFALKNFPLSYLLDILTACTSVLYAILK